MPVPCPRGEQLRSNTQVGSTAASRPSTAEAESQQRADHITGGGVPLPCPETRLALNDIYQGL